MENSKKTVLLVEDEMIYRHTLVPKLLSEGFAVLEADNGASGLSMALQHKPDLILLDLVMPTMDGMHMLQKLHEDVWGKTAKIVILTNLDQNDSIASALQNNAFDYIVKTNITVEHLLEKIREKLQ